MIAVLLPVGENRTRVLDPKNIVTTIAKCHLDIEALIVFDNNVVVIEFIREFIARSSRYVDQAWSSRLRRTTAECRPHADKNVFAVLLPVGGNRTRVLDPSNPRRWPNTHDDGLIPLTYRNFY